MTEGDIKTSMLIGFLMTVQMFKFILICFTEFDFLQLGFCSKVVF